MLELKLALMIIAAIDPLMRVRRQIDQGKVQQQDRTTSNKAKQQVTNKGQRQHEQNKQKRRDITAAAITAAIAQRRRLTTQLRSWMSQQHLTDHRNH